MSIFASALWVAAALGAGYGLGRLRPGRRASDWAGRVESSTRFEHRRYRWPGLAVMCASIAAHPLRSARNARSWRETHARRPLREDTDHA